MQHAFGIGIRQTQPSRMGSFTPHQLMPQFFVECDCRIEVLNWQAVAIEFTKERVWYIFGLCF